MPEPVSENGWTRRELLKRLKEAENKLECTEAVADYLRLSVKTLKHELGTLPVVKSS
jgi:hypothetical protein